MDSAAPTVSVSRSARPLPDARLHRHRLSPARFRRHPRNASRFLKAAGLRPCCFSGAGGLGAGCITHLGLGVHPITRQGTAIGPAGSMILGAQPMASLAYTSPSLPGSHRRDEPDGSGNGWRRETHETWATACSNVIEASGPTAASPGVLVFAGDLSECTSVEQGTQSVDGPDDTKGQSNVTANGVNRHPIGTHRDHRRADAESDGCRSELAARRHEHSFSVTARDRQASGTVSQLTHGQQIFGQFRGTRATF